jgi:transcription elongation factor S-II
MIKISNSTSFRNNVREKLENQFAITNRENVINLEKGVYNFAIKEANARKIIKKWENSRFVQLYTDRLRSIFVNLKNSELLFALNSGEITPQQLAFMTHQEMDPEHWRKWIEQKAMRDANKFTNNIQASTDMFTCKKCKGKRCTYYELQTRSADEPATIFVTCLDCGKNWKS